MAGPTGGTVRLEEIDRNMTDQTTPGESRRVTFPDDLLSPNRTLLESAELIAGAGVRVLPVTSAPDQNGVSSVKKPGRLLGKKW